MKFHQTLIITAVSSLLLPALASATVVTVDATDNIFASGLSSADNVDPGDGGGGTLPLQINVTGGAYQFQYESGYATPDIYNSGYDNLDANGVPNQPSNISAYGSISGYLADQGVALVGVFLGSGAPSGPAPSTIDFTTAGIGSDFLSLSPQIGQIFLIGDGVTSMGQPHTFYAPAGATELYLGFADSYDFSGPPGQYGDNGGSVNMNVAIVPVPEPAPVSLLLLGSSLMGLLLFRNKR